MGYPFSSMNTIEFYLLKDLHYVQIVEIGLELYPVINKPITVGEFRKTYLQTDREEITLDDWISQNDGEYSHFLITNLSGVTHIVVDEVD